MPAAGFEPAIPATKQPQTYALVRAASPPWLDQPNNTDITMKNTNYEAPHYAVISSILVLPAF
jgi:hypothetical protein